MIASVALGFGLGAALSAGIPRKVGFWGWIPAGMAAVALALVLAAGTALAEAWNPFDADFDRALVLVLTAIAAGGSIYRFTLLDA